MSVIFNVLIAARPETRCFVWLLFSRQWNSENKRKVSESELKRKLLTLALWWLLSCAFSRFCFSIEISGKVKFHLINREKWHLMPERWAARNRRNARKRRSARWFVMLGLRQMCWFWARLSSQEDSTHESRTLPYWESLPVTQSITEAHPQWRQSDTSGPIAEWFLRLCFEPEKRQPNQ